MDISPAKLAEFLRREPWENLTYKTPPEAAAVSGMISTSERKMLTWLVANLYSGKGEIVDLGAFIGASAVCLAAGLSASRAADKRKRIHSFDRFTGDYPVEWIRQNTNFTTDGASYLNVYRKQMQSFAECIDVIPGDLLEIGWNGKPIEVLFLDVLKSAPLATAVVSNFFPSLQPGSIVIAQDYLHESLPYTVGVMEHFSEFFIRAGDTKRGSVLFVVSGDIPATTFRWGDIPETLRLDYLIRAAAKESSFVGREMMANLIADFVRGKYR